MTFTEDQIKILNDAIRRYGVDMQTDIAIEEMSELTKAIIKERRIKSAATVENVCEEIADVLIMMEQLCLIYPPGYIEKYINFKLQRLEKRLSKLKKKENNHE